MIEDDDPDPIILIGKDLVRASVVHAVYVEELLGYDASLTAFLQHRGYPPKENWRNDPLYFSAKAKRMKREGKI